MSAPFRAATVICLRPAPGLDDVEVLFVRRNARASFMANAYVFPGGRVDSADAEPNAEQATRRCAARELSEEAGLRVDNLDELVYFARWVTPSAEPKRFDADFFLWGILDGQTPVVDATEVFDLRFYTPSDAIAAYEAGQLNLPPPTVCTLEDLRAEIARVRDVKASAPLLARVLEACRARRPQPLLPKLRANDSGGMEILMPWDVDFATAPGEGSAALQLAEGAASVAQRISRCTLVPPGVWQVSRSA